MAHASPALAPVLTEWRMTTARLGPGDIAPNKQISPSESQSSPSTVSHKHRSESQEYCFLTSINPGLRNRNGFQKT